MATVAISSDFLTAFAALPRHVQGKVTDFVNKFRNDPTSPGINYEKINDAADKKMCSVRIDDTYRGIVVRQQETGVYLLLWVDHHDEAYGWARRKKCEVNLLPATHSGFRYPACKR
jgi:mRNA-degrading endonuclease RelE of RelBE toxin-antitoxin system